jgi:hypothetical protein
MWVMPVEDDRIEALEPQRATPHVSGGRDYFSPGVDELRHLAFEVFAEAAFSAPVRFGLVCPAFIAAAADYGGGSQTATRERGPR